VLSHQRTAAAVKIHIPMETQTHSISTHRHRGVEVPALCQKPRAASAVWDELPGPQIEVVRIVDMSAPNAWAVFAADECLPQSLSNF
jgi:hypothetical protein